MTVGELEEQLRGFPRSFEVVLTINNGNYDDLGATLRAVNPLPYSQRVELLGEFDSD